MQESSSVPYHSWKPPRIDGSRHPRLIAHGKPQMNDDCPQNFFRCAKWSPDGNHVLGQCENSTLQMLRRPTEPLASSTSTLYTGSVFAQAAPILDFAWYPGAHSLTPSTFCFLASIRECPIKLLDAENGRLRASYKIVDHRERQVAPHCIAFNLTASQFYCGYEDAIEVFDLQRPGAGFKIPTTPSKKSKDGMKGIVSSISFCSDYSGLFAASSLSSAITLLTEASGADPVAYLDGMVNAITQVKFDPYRPYLLYAAQRRSSEILCWDVREPHEVLRRFRAPGSRRTNQKSYFDLDPAGRWLCYGEENGYVSIFDLETQSESLAARFCAHEDSIGSVSFNPVDASLLTVSGSRHFDALPTIPATMHEIKTDLYNRPGSSSDSSASGVETDMETSSLAPESHSPSVSDDSDSSAEEDRELRSSPSATLHLRRKHTWPYVCDNSVSIWAFDRSIELATNQDVGQPSSSTAAETKSAQGQDNSSTDQQ